MKLSNEMREVLNNFSKINDNLVIGAEPGVVRTVATSRNIMAKASITEDFPFKFGIYDLNEFLSCLNMFEDPTLAFEQKYVNITDGQQAIKYWFSEPENLTTSNKEIKMPVCEVKFTLTDDQLSKIRKASSALKADQLVIEKLDEKKALINCNDYHHSYPHCWRHKTPLVFTSTAQWFNGEHCIIERTVLSEK